MTTTGIQRNIWWIRTLLMVFSLQGGIWGIGNGWINRSERAIAQTQPPETVPLYLPEAPPERRTPLPDQRQQIEEQTVGVDKRVSALQLDSRNNGLWVGSWQGIAKINPSTGQITDRISLPNQTVGSLAQDKSGRIWVGTYAGLSRVDPKTGAITAQNFALPSNRVLDLLVDQRGFLWVGTDAGLAMISPDQGLLMTTIKNLPGVSANALALDPLGNLWVGTLDGLVEVNTANAFIKRRIENLPGVMVQALATSPWGTLWIGTPRGLLEADVGIKRVVQVIPPPTAKTTRSLTGKPNSRTLPASKKGATAAKPKVQRRVVFQASETPKFELRSLSQLQGRDVTALHFDRISSLWVGTTSGLLRVNPFNGATGGEITNLPSSRIFSLSPDTGGKLWVGTSEGLSWVNTKTFKGQPHQTFRSAGQ